MKLHYGAYGTLHRQRQQYLAAGKSKEDLAYLSVSQNAREEAGFSLPTGPADMATEVERERWSHMFEQLKAYL